MNVGGLGTILVSPRLARVSPVGSAQIIDLEKAAQQNQQAMKLYAAGCLGEATKLAERVLALREKALGPEHRATGTSLNNLAELYRATGAYAQAEPLYKRALAINERALGPEQPDTAGSLNNPIEAYVLVLVPLEEVLA